MNKPAPNVPITMGSPTYRTLELDCFQVTEAWFPAHAVLADHTHDRACVAVMLDGSFDLHFPGKAYPCPPTTVFTEPAGETHANFIGSGGAHVVVVQPDPTETELLRPFAGLIDRATHRHHAGLAEQASRLTQELNCGDDLTTLAAEGIVLEMLVTLARLDSGAARRPPAWLLRARSCCTPSSPGPCGMLTLPAPLGCTQPISPVRSGCISRFRWDATCAGSGWTGPRESWFVRRPLWRL
jgi:quercetin dioxygenase-like cupin family protein